MEVIRISPRGYCYGVVDALQTVRQVAKDPTHPRPIYIIGQIVHNRHAIEELTNLGVITLDGPDRVSILDQVKEGTVIFTAHGVSSLVKRRASERGLHCIDATCPDVTVASMQCKPRSLALRFTRGETPCAVKMTVPSFTWSRILTRSGPSSVITPRFVSSSIA